LERTTPGGAAISISVEILGTAFSLVCSFSSKASGCLDSSFLKKARFVPHANKNEITAAAAGMY
jgi:hypothetical protein